MGNATVNETGGTPGLELPPPKGNAAMMQAEIFARGPIACTVYADAAMDDYTGGILNGGDEGMPNHIVSVVGWGQQIDPKNSSNITKYWHVRNSWGEFYGEMGYLRLAHGSNDIESGCNWATPGSW